MSKILSFRIYYCLLILTAATSCTQTSVVDTWSDRALLGNEYDNIATVAISSSEATRRLFEDELVKKLEAKGIQATTTYGLIPNGSGEFESIRTALANTPADAILTSRVIGIDKELTYYPGSSMYAPYYGYYNHYYLHAFHHPFYYTPGYISTNVEVVLETNLYDADTGKLVWSAQSRTWDPRSIRELASSAGSELVEKLMKQDIISSSQRIG